MSLQTTKTQVTTEEPKKNLRLHPYTLDDVAKHNTAKDAWVALNGWVLDITFFFPLHPGGGDILKGHIGTDISKVFRDPKEHIHSIAANNLLKKFRIGYLKDVLKEEEILNAVEETVKPSDYGIDLEKGLVWQTAWLGDKYVEFIENTFVATEKVELRYFDSGFFEAFSKSPWYTVPFLWLPILAMVVFLAFREGASMKVFSFYVFGGMICWMFMEYMLHRHIFHMKTKTFFLELITFLLTWISPYCTDGWGKVNFSSSASSCFRCYCL